MGIQQSYRWELKKHMPNVLKSSRLYMSSRQKGVNMEIKDMEAVK